MAKRDPIIISDATPLVVGDLTVFPDRLQHRDTRCNFRDIEHLGWHWLSQTINFLNTQSVTFTIHVRGLARPISISKTTMYVTPKLVTAYNFIAQETFQSRLRQYTDQLDQHGGFTFQEFTIYSDGRIQGKGNTFHLRDAEFEPFQMSIKQGGFFGPRLNLDLTLDKDVIVSIFHFILKNPHDPQEVRTAAEQRRRTQQSADLFLVDTISMLAKLATADGSVSSDEIAVIKDFAANALDLSAERMKAVVSIFQTARNSAESFEFHARRLFQAHRADTNLLRHILDLLFEVASADNQLSAEEELLLLEAEDIFGIAGPAFTSFRTQKEREHRAHRHTHHTSKSEYLRIMGLDVSSGPTEIKAKYRQLVMQYHPDRVHHLGPQFRSEAEKHMKTINVAYEALCKRHGI